MSNNNSYSGYKKSIQNNESNRRRSDRPKRSERAGNGTSRGRAVISKKRNGASVQSPPKGSRTERKRLEEQRKRERSAARKARWNDLVGALKELTVKMGMILAILLVLAGVMGTITLKSEIDLLKFENNELTSQLEQKKEVIKELNSKKEATYKSETIENIARYKLGMIYPTKEQTVYIYLD